MKTIKYIKVYHNTPFRNVREEANIFKKIFPFYFQRYLSISGNIYWVEIPFIGFKIKFNK